MDRITVIRQSLTAFICGLIGFLPVIGLLPAIRALSIWNRIRRRYRNEWNPASAYLSWGAFLAILGILDSILLVASIMISVD
jgi:hypothetical protein